MIPSIPMPEVRRSKLKALLENPSEAVRLLEAHNGLSGKVVDSCAVGMPDGSRKEFHGIWVSGLTDSASMALPDLELFGIQSRMKVIRELCAVTHKPIVVDGDSGGTIEQFYHSLSTLCRKGVSAMIVEDKLFPKPNSLDLRKVQVLEDKKTFAEKLAKGRKFLDCKEFMILARTEALVADMGMKEALSRTEAYLEAGADGIVIHSRRNEPAEVLTFAKEYHRLFGSRAKPLIAIPTTYNAISESELYHAGFKMVIHANHLLRSALLTMQSVAQRILASERSLEVEKDCIPLKDLFSFVDGFSEKA